MSTKTYPQLGAQSGVEDADLLATWRSVGPLKKISASTLQTYMQLGVVTDVTKLGVVTGSTSDQTAEIQAAINTGRPLVFPESAYYAHGLTQATIGQQLIGLGDVQIIKNANGDLFTSTARNVTCQDIQFRGDAQTPVYTGHNVVSTGAYFSLLNCGSRWAYARAVKATGNRVQIRGTCDIYQTADGAGDPDNAYEIEVGLAGTARLYSLIEGITTEQSSGGILVKDTGSLNINNSQFGKLTIQSSVSPPGGSNGGITKGCRILGDVSVGLSGAVFAANQFGAVDIVLELGTANCTIDLSNIFENGATVTNNGNASSNLIMRNVGDGADVVGPIIRVGDDNSAVYVDTQYPLGRGPYLIGGGYLGGDTAVDLQGAGSPEGAVTAAVGSTYRRTNGGAGSSFYVKESGSGNTGWVAK